jgi:hypothetical protein
MNREPDFLYNLLPAVYRQKDIALGQPLRALCATLQGQYDLLEADIGALYDDWFVETCEPWILAYLGELVAAGRLGRRAHPGIDTRSLVANTLAYRRRKGTPATLERAVEEATGWPSRIVEARRLIAMTPSVARASAVVGANVDVRDARALAHLGGAFDGSPRTATVRPSGLYNLDRLGVFQWRLQSYPLEQVDAGAVAGRPERRTFHPLGLDMPLFNRRFRRVDHEAAITESRLPTPLARHMFAADLATHPDGFADEAPFRIRLADPADPARARTLKPADVVVADLSEWRRPAQADARAAVDPERGRLLLLDPKDEGARVTTDHSYGFAGDIGGGPYARAPSPLDSDRLRRGAWLGEIWEGAPDPPETDLQDLIDAWRRQPPDAEPTPSDGPVSSDAVLTLPDSRTYAPARAAGGEPAAWRIDLKGRPGRNLAIVARSGERPCLAGALEVVAGDEGGTLILDGLMIGGPVRVSGNLMLIVRHCTILTPQGEPSICAHPGGLRPSDLHVLIDSSLVGPVRLPPEGTQLDIRDSIVDGGGAEAIGGAGGAGPGPQALITAATINGAARVRTVEASDSLFLCALVVEDTHRGYVRHSYLGAPSETPQRFKCLPPHDAPSGHGAPARPRFVSRRPGQPGYFYFSPGAPREILTGASDGLAMGAFHRLGEALRLDNFADALGEYAPYGVTVLTDYAS